MNVISKISFSHHEEIAWVTVFPVVWFTWWLIVCVWIFTLSGFYYLFHVCLCVCVFMYVHMYLFIIYVIIIIVVILFFLLSESNIMLVLLDYNFLFLFLSLFILMNDNSIKTQQYILNVFCFNNINIFLFYKDQTIHSECFLFQ